MATNSKIQWTHHTANLWEGCSKVHAGCDHCYAEGQSHRWGRDLWGPDKPRRLGVGVWKDLFKWQRAAADLGEIHRVFVGSMMDIGEKPMPLVNGKGEPAIDASDGSPICTDYARDKFFNEYVLQCPNLDFLLLSKRPSNYNKQIPESWKKDPPANVMFGTSPVDQPTANKLLPQLLEVNGRRFLSIEPMIGRIDLSGWLVAQEDTESGILRNPIDWIIVGGESGNAKTIRPLHPDWARSVRDQAKRAGIPFFFKQWGEYLPYCQYELGHAYPVSEKDARFFPSPNNANKTNTYYKLGKYASGRLLDGVLHDAFPPSSKKV